LGAKLKNTVLLNGVVDWGMSSSKYVQSVFQNVQEYLTVLTDSKKLLKKPPCPIHREYKPELDESPDFDPIMANFFQS
jgi:hypothetical protein